MATVPAPRTVAAGDGVTAALWNRDVRDSVNFLVGPPIALLRQTVAQSIPNNVFTVLLFDVEDLDRDGGHSTTADTSRYTAKTAGYYMVSVNVGYSANTTGGRALGLQKTTAAGVTTNVSGIVSTPASGYDAHLSITRLLYLAVGDYVEAKTHQNSGGALNTRVVDLFSQPAMHILWVSS